MIEFKNIEIKYGDFVAIKDLNLTVGDGEFFTFLGPSGCGKTTTLRALVGFLEPSAGQILIDGKDVTHTPVEKRNIGMVFQSYALFPTMTVYENLAFGLKVKKLSAAEIDRKVKDVAKVIEIKSEQLVRNVSELSGGQQQRVALARAIVLEPKILCLDEPLSNLDAKLRVGLRSELKSCRRTWGSLPYTLPTIRRRPLPCPTGLPCLTMDLWSRWISLTTSITIPGRNLSAILSVKLTG